jgi:hypothetical protein
VMKELDCGKNLMNYLGEKNDHNVLFSGCA